jgi:hypothetical protein
VVVPDVVPVASVDVLESLVLLVGAKERVSYRSKGKDIT